MRDHMITKLFVIVVLFCSAVVTSLPAVVRADRFLVTRVHVGARDDALDWARAMVSAAVRIIR